MLLTKSYSQESVLAATMKSRPHQQHCRMLYKSNDFFDKVERYFDIVAVVDGA